MPQVCLRLREILLLLLVPHLQQARQLLPQQQVLPRALDQQELLLQQQQQAQNLLRILLHDLPQIEPQKLQYQLKQTENQLA
jgi:hypothetical protein